MSEKKTEIIQIRVGAELKKQFYEIARQRGYDPSEYLRTQMEKVVSEKDGLDEEIANITDKLDETRTLLDEMRLPVMELMEVLVKISNRTEDQAIINQVDRSSIRNYYEDYAKDMAHEESRDTPHTYDQRLEYWLKRGLETHQIPEAQPLGPFALPGTGSRNYWQLNRAIIKEEEANDK